jgi:protein SCO1/2
MKRETNIETISLLLGAGHRNWLHSDASPHPRPLPQGEGESVAASVGFELAFDCIHHDGGNVMRVRLNNVCGALRQRALPDAKRHAFRRTLRHSLAAFILLARFITLPCSAQSLTDQQLSRVDFDQKLNSQLDVALPFHDEAGRTVKLGDCFDGKPTVLVLGYYECPMLCTLTFNGMVESLEDIKWSIGREFNVIHISIDPHETPALASAKKQTYLKRYGRAGAAAGWHFLTGDDAAIRKVADEIGFHYAYDPSVHQYAHPSGLVVVTPEGRVTKYFFGVTFSATDLHAALQDAAKNQIGSPIQRLILLCFHYRPVTGKYGTLIVHTIRLFGVTTLVGMLWLFARMIRSEQRRTTSTIAPLDTASTPPATVDIASDRA